MLRYLTAGESHGRALVVIVEGLPAGLPVQAGDIADELARRRLGYGRGPRMRFEADEITLVGGIRHGRTLGSPVAIEIANSEWPKWTEEMSPDPGAPAAVLTQPRPGHADLPGMQKYGFDDARDVLERASARETAARVAAGTLAKLLLSHLGVAVVSHIVALGDAATTHRTAHARARRTWTGSTRARCAASTRRLEEAMIAAVKAAAKDGRLARGRGRGPGLRRPGRPGQPRALGPQARCAAGPGPHEHPGRQGRRDRRGLGQRRPPRARRPMTPSPTTSSDGYVRPTARAGGIEGGISNGALLVARVAMKPLATLNRPVLETVDVVTKESTVSFRERTDVTAVPAMGVVAETMTALVLAVRGPAQVRRRLAGRGRAQPRRLRGRPGDHPVGGAGPGQGCRGLRSVTRRILLVGMMGAGKTTVGQLIGRGARLGLPRLRRRGGGGDRH